MCPTETLRAGMMVERWRLVPEMARVVTAAHLDLPQIVDSLIFFPTACVFFLAIWTKQIQEK